MSQAGVYKISLYENKGVSFTYPDASDLFSVTGLTNTGEVIEITNDQRIDFDFDIKTGDNAKILFDYTLKFFLFDLTVATIQEAQKIKESVYGWLLLVTFYDGTTKFYNVPFFCPDDAPIKIQDSMAFEVTLKNRVPSSLFFFNYLSAAEIAYKADTTVLTADSTAITADYTIG